MPHPTRLAAVRAAPLQRHLLNSISLNPQFSPFVIKSIQTSCARTLAWTATPASCQLTWLLFLAKVFDALEEESNT